MYRVRRRLRMVGVFVAVISVVVSGCALNSETPEASNTVDPSPTAQQIVEASGSGDPVETDDGNAPARQIADTPTATPVPPTATSEPSPSPTATPQPPTPTPGPQLRQLTTGGCCTQPFWSSDSQQVLYIDAPPPDGPTSIWSVDVAQPANEPTLFTERIAFYTGDFEYVVDLDGNTTVIERLSDGERWTVPAAGNLVYLSPNRQRIAWNDSDEDVPWEERITQVWVANADGSDPELVAQQRRGGFDGWLSDDTILLEGRESFETDEEVTVAYSLADGSRMELIRDERVRGTSLSPDRRWLAYYIAQHEDPSKNGIWLVRTDGSERRHLDIELFGAYKWRDADRLLLVPFRPDAAYHELWQYDVETEEVRQLTDADTTPFKIANGDWSVSPDGQYVAFVESSDRNIWVLELN